MVKKLKKDIFDFTQAGVGLGMGTAIVAGTGHGAKITPAFATFGGMMGPVGTAVMGSNALRIFNSSYGKKKKKY